MGDYYRAEQLASKVGLSLEELQQAQTHGLIRPVYRNGLAFYTSQSVYKLKAACVLKKKNGLNWAQVAAEIGKRPLYQVTSR